MLEVHSFVNTPVSSNCFVLFDKDFGKDCVIVDPGSRDEIELVSFLFKEDFTPLCIILTHEHFDHCWGVNQLVDLFQTPIICSRLCAEAINHEKQNCSVFYDQKQAFTINCKTINTESLDNVFMFGNHEIRFYNTPGHTSASISFVVDGFLFTGDTLIKDKKTVTKLPTGSIEELKDSLKLFATMQKKDFMVFPGHGESFQLGDYALNKSINV